MIHSPPFREKRLSCFSFFFSEQRCTPLFALREQLTQCIVVRKHREIPERGMQAEFVTLAGMETARLWISETTPDSRYERACQGCVPGLLRRDQKPGERRRDAPCRSIQCVCVCVCVCEREREGERERECVCMYVFVDVLFLSLWILLTAGPSLPFLFHLTTHAGTFH
jgi:hypothetical protein